MKVSKTSAVCLNVKLLTPLMKGPDVPNRASDFYWHRGVVLGYWHQRANERRTASPGRGLLWGEIFGSALQ